ncbi:hypothetical protein GCM10023321_31220 [Pseudonocardia eucalypti]|uniref:HTH tetR-type domain-containing protein n=2 Tax=Pseudonocardia eucalypti TaxID=648755 RepID=A0ABP9Q3G7_9PSEU
MIVDTALQLMDTDGYAAFSMPKLGDVLGIRTPSLYHHFRDRAEIMAEVARRVVRETQLPERRSGDHWTEYFVELSTNFRATILRHRNAAPVLVQFLPRDIMTSLYETAAVLLNEVAELPKSQHVLIIDGLERLTIGSALVESSLESGAAPGSARSAFPNVDAERQPHLAEAVRSNERDAEQLFIASVRAFLAGATNGTPALRAP